MTDSSIVSVHLFIATMLIRSCEVETISKAAIYIK